ncbi:MAG: hypothetical protein ACOC1P_01275 [Minisyncoccales bacterium]
MVLKKGVIKMLKKLLIILIILIIGVIGIYSSAKEKIELKVIDTENIVENNPAYSTYVQNKKLQEKKIRIAVFQIKGRQINETLLREWVKEDKIKGKYIGLDDRGAWFEAKNNQIEIWTSADKDLSAEGKVKIIVKDEDDDVVITKISDFKINYEKEDKEEANKEDNKEEENNNEIISSPF